MFPNIGSQPKPDIGLPPGSAAGSAVGGLAKPGWITWIGPYVPPAIAIIGAVTGGALAAMIIYEAYLQWRATVKYCDFQYIRNGFCLYQCEDGSILHEPKGLADCPDRIIIKK
jgi:hypothetical protein